MAFVVRWSLRAIEGPDAADLWPNDVFTNDYSPKEANERIRDAVERAYAAKYNTPGSVKYVRGFRTRRRRDATMELRPR